jgi:hypothetical protein
VTFVKIITNFGAAGPGNHDFTLRRPTSYQYFLFAGPLDTGLFHAGIDNSELLITKGCGQ